MISMSDAVARAEQDVLGAKRAAERARAASAAAGPGDLVAKHAAEDAEQAHRDAGRRLAELRRDAEADAELDRLQSVVAYRLEGGRMVETLDGLRERQDHGTPLLAGAVAYDAAP